MQSRVRSELQEISPLDATERSHLEDAIAWVDSGAPLFRIARPASPPKHLVSYFAVIDDRHILLVDHKNGTLAVRVEFTHGQPSPQRVSGRSTDCAASA